MVLYLHLLSGALNQWCICIVIRIFFLVPCSRQTEYAIFLNNQHCWLQHVMALKYHSVACPTWITCSTWMHIVGWKSGVARFKNCFSTIKVQIARSEDVTKKGGRLRNHIHPLNYVLLRKAKPHLFFHFELNKETYRATFVAASNKYLATKPNYYRQSLTHNWLLFAIHITYACLT